MGRVDLSRERPPLLPPGLVLRSVRLDDGARWPEHGALAPGTHRGLFGLAASAFAPAAEFSTRLEGWEDDWSPWSARREQEVAAGFQMKRLREMLSDHGENGAHH